MFNSLCVLRRVACILAGTALLGACGGGGGGAVTPVPLPAFKVGGTVSGLQSGNTLVLTNNGVDSLSVSTNGSFGFATSLQSGANYQVALAQQPSGHTCTVSSGSGTIGMGDVASVLVVCVAVPLVAQVETVFGVPPGSADGTWAKARFYRPDGIVSDAEGNLFVADAENYVVRKVSVTGQVTTLAGKAGENGSVDGKSADARFGMLRGIARNAQGELFVADAGNHTVRKIALDGTVSTLAGLAGSTGFVNGIGAAARFNSPRGIAITGSGNILITEMQNHSVRMITPVGTVSTYAGMGVRGHVNGSAETAQFSFPMGIAVDGAGNVYVADYANSAIRRITPDRQVETFAGGPQRRGYVDGNIANARFRSISDVAVDRHGAIYVADRVNRLIRRIANDEVTTYAGKVQHAGSQDGLLGVATLNTPASMALGSQGDLYFTDQESNTVRKVDASGVVITLAGLASLGAEEGVRAVARSGLIGGLTVDSSGTVYFTDITQNLVRKLDKSGVVSTVAGLVGAPAYQDGAITSARFYLPSGITLSKAGELYIADTNNHVIRKVASGQVTTSAGSGSQLSLPIDLVFRATGELLIVDGGNAKLYQRDLAGVTTVFSGMESGVHIDGPKEIAGLVQPGAIALDQDENAYVVEETLHTVRMVDKAGTIRTIAGAPEQSGSEDGPSGLARFNAPSGIAVAKNGIIYVADAGNAVIRKITLSGVVSTIAGRTGTRGFSDGAAGNARFGYPSRITLDSQGTLWVADGSVIRKITLPADN